MAIDPATIQALAEANGISIPQDRLELVLKQYQGFLRTLEQMDTVELTRETEPAITFSNTLPSFQPANPPERK